MLKTVLIFVTIFFAHYSSAEDIDLFIIAGQSNAQGWKGNGAYYPKDIAKIDKHIRFYWVTPTYSSSNGQWTTLKTQAGKFKQGHFGPEITFARALQTNGFNPAVFKYTLGATSIAKNWKLPGQKGMYDDMLADFRKARTLLENKGNNVRVRGFIWIQGESDAQNKTMAEAYYKKLKLIIKDIRMNLVGNPTLPVILGVDEQFPWIKLHPQIVQAQKLLAKEDEHVIFTSMIGLEKADNTHLTPKGLADHGKRLFAAYIELVKTNANKKY